MNDEEILVKTNKEKSLAGLHTHTGWKHLQSIMREEKDRLKKQLLTVDPNENITIAKIQSKIEILNKYIDKPERYFHKYTNGG